MPIDGDASQQEPELELPEDPPTQASGDTPKLRMSRRFERLGLERLPLSRRVIWSVLGGACAVAGTVASILGAHAVAGSDAASVGKTFPRTSAGISRTLASIASGIAPAIQREEDLAIGASTFFAGHPNATVAELTRWVKWSQAPHRYPELEKLGLVSSVRAPQPATSPARIAGGAKTLLSSNPSLTPAGSLHPAPTSTHPSCSEVVLSARNPAGSARAGIEHCTLNSRLLSSRDTGHNIYARASTRQGPGLSIEIPVYMGNQLPLTLSGRRDAFVGWLRETIAPEVLLRQALRGYPGYAVHLRHRSGRANVAFGRGTPAPGATIHAFNLHGGWAARAFGPAAAPSPNMLSDGGALALLIAGALFSVLFGVLVFFLGNGRPSQPVAKKKRAVAPPDLHDPLTGLPNRALTLDRAERMVARTGRQSGMLAGALFVDVDWFKQINEKLGEAAGDQVLKVFAKRLATVVRADDTVGRLGADKFAVLVESAARGVRLDSLARRMIEELHKPIELDEVGPRFFSTASIGVAFGRYATPEDLLRDAQLALVAAKSAGKDRYTVFNANMRTIIESRAVLEDELNDALREGQFFLLYQPVYDLGDRRVAGLEAQIRWTHPKQGVLPPGDFIPLAEESGQIVPIGRWMLEEACNRAAAWNVAGHRIDISVKVSASQLHRDGFLTDVRRALQQSGIQPSRLTLEVAEQTVMRDIAAASERLAEIKGLGVRIAIDDFGGSGYARHSDLKQMPLDVLKVDRASIAVSEDEDYRSWLLEAILVFGRDLSLSVIATGVETDEQLETLRAMGCTMAQGSYAGKPAPTESVEALLEGELAVAEPVASQAQLPAVELPAARVQEAPLPGVQVQDAQVTGAQDSISEAHFPPAQDPDASTVRVEWDRKPS